MNALFVLLALGLFLSPINGEVMTGLKVSGNKLVNKDGKIVRLTGVNRSGMEFMCIQGYGLYDGPVDQNAVTNMLAWKINAVRVPLNEDCWLGINGVKAEYGGNNYISAVKSYVNLLTNNSLAVILDLHWTAAGGTPATKQDPMPNMDHSPAFWTGVAQTFKSYSNVIFDLFNEPYPDNNNWNSDNAWKCWSQGGSACTNLGYTAAGVQTLVNTVRSTGANNIILLGGVAYANSVAQWLKYKPNDSANQLMAAVHIYNFNYCITSSCWDQYIAPVVDQVPVTFSEIGENDCNSGFISTLMGWADSHGVGYLGWTWNNWNCNDGPALITDYSGAATNFGAGFKAHLAQLSE